MSFILFSIVAFALALFEVRLVYFLFFVMCSAFYSLTFGYSYDWINYYDTFNAARMGVVNYNFTFIEPGYYYLAKALSNIGLDFSGFVLFCGIFNFYCLYRFTRYTEQPTFVFLIIFSFFGYSIYCSALRQAIALSFDLLAITSLLYEKSKKRFYFFSVLGFLFHLSSLVVLLYIPLTKINSANYKRFLVVFSILGIFTLYLISDSSLLSWIPYVGDKISAYAGQFQDSGVTFLGYILGSKSILMYFVLFIFSLVIGRVNKKMHMVSVALLIIIICRSNPVLLRFSYFFVPYLAIALSNSYSGKDVGFNIKVSKIVFLFSLVLTSTMYYWTPAYRQASDNYLWFDASDKDISNIIGRQCGLLNKYIPDQIVIYRCR